MNTRYLRGNIKLFELLKNVHRNAAEMERILTDVAGKTVHTKTTWFYKNTFGLFCDF